MDRDCCCEDPYLANSMGFLFIRLAPYERRVIELLRNSKDKRARKLAKKRVRKYLHLSYDQRICIAYIRFASRISVEAYMRYMIDGM